MPTVLVVNDDPDMLQMYEAVLEELGHRSELREDMNPKPGDVIAAGADALVIDLQADSDQLAGLRAVEVIRAHPATRGLPIVMATAAAEDVRPLISRLKELDVPVLIKPFAIDKLRAVLEMVLPSPEEQAPTA